MSSFKPGDVVRLKSGGPDMTVSSDGETKGYVNCVWFPTPNTPQPCHNSFPESCLEKTTPSPALDVMN
jgi:uncharacterized protein YodC (DUF2158 family)